MSERQPDLPGLSTTDMDLTKVMDTFQEEPPVQEDDTPKPSPEDIDVPIYTPKDSKQKGKLVKREDKEFKDRYPGATYEVKQFDLWKEEDVKEYQSLMSEVGTDKYSRVVFQDRVYIEDKKSWKVLVEVQHFVLVAR
jgi:hypothetical protein